MSFIGKNIKKIRGVKGLSQQAFAELFDLKRATLGAYEEGRSEPRIDTIIKIANYFSIPIDDLLTAELTVNALLQFRADLTLEIEVMEKEQFPHIPIITAKNTIDYIKFHDKEKFIKDLPVLQLPIAVEEKLRAYTVQNLEMTQYEKGLYPGDVVIGRQRLLTELTAAGTNDGVLVLALIGNELVLRRMYEVGEQLVFKADHKNIADKTFPKTSLKELWEISSVYFNRLPELGNPLEDKMEFLEREFRKLKDKM